jgi:hypothetical protein
MSTRHRAASAIGLAAWALGWGLAPAASAHCDTLDGPVVVDARSALEHRDVTPVLKWVKPDDEGEVRSAFDSAIAVRDMGPAARLLADRYFFETLVRLHRAGEGAPFAGLKPAGTELNAAVADADAALESGSVDRLADLVTEAADQGTRVRFAVLMEAKRHVGASVEAGRAYVAAYVEFVHYVERLYVDATTPAAHAAGEEHEAGEGHEEHHAD